MSPSSTFDYRGHVALVVGGASGIGQATCRALGSSGASVAVADIDAEKGHETVHALKEDGCDAMFLEMDVRHEESVDRGVRQVVERFGALHSACNAASIEGISTKLGDIDVEEWDRVVAINLKGTFLCIKHEIRAMLQGGSGAITNVSSVFGLVGSPLAPAYTAAKHGVLGLTRSAAVAYAKKGIRVNAVCPGFAKTPMLERMVQEVPGLEERFAASHPMGRLASPQEVAHAILFLNAKGSEFITGAALSADGGYVAR